MGMPSSFLVLLASAAVFDVCDCSFSDIVIHDSVRGITFTDVRARQGDSSYIWAWKGKPFKDIALRNVDLNGGLEVINVNGFRIEGGTAKVTALSEKTLGERNRMLETCTEFIW